MGESYQICRNWPNAGVMWLIDSVNSGFIVLKDSMDVSILLNANN